MKMLLPSAPILAATILLCCTSHAAAYYDPNPQRWINRDPVGDSGFANLHRATPGQTSSGEPNAYRFVRNDPMDDLDPNGLLCYEILVCVVGKPFTVTCYTVVQYGTGCVQTPPVTVDVGPVGYCGAIGLKGGFFILPILY